MEKYDKIFVGTGPVSVVDALLEAESGKSVLLIDEKSAVGGAWGTIQVGDYGKLEIGCHIWSYQKESYEFMKDFFELDLIELKPQPYFIKGKTRLSYDRKNALRTLQQSAGYMRRFDMKGLRDFIKNNPSARIPIFSKKYLYPKGGARDLQNAIINKIDKSNLNIKLNTQILSINKKDGFWELKDTNGTVFQASTIRLTSTSSIKQLNYHEREFKISHTFVNYSHFHIVIKGKLLKPCSYIRVLGNDLIHRLCDITYQMEKVHGSDLNMLLVGFFDDEKTPDSESVILEKIKTFLIDNKFVQQDVAFIYAQKNRFETSYISNDLCQEITTLDDSIELIHTTDLMYGIYYKLPEWNNRY